MRLKRVGLLIVTIASATTAIAGAVGILIWMASEARGTPSYLALLAASIAVMAMSAVAGTFSELARMRIERS